MVILLGPHLVYTWWGVQGLCKLVFLRNQTLKVGPSSRTMEKAIFHGPWCKRALSRSTQQEGGGLGSLHWTNWLCHEHPRASTSMPKITMSMSKFMLITNWSWSLVNLVITQLLLSFPMIEATNYTRGPLSLVPMSATTCPALIITTLNTWFSVALTLVC